MFGSSEEVESSRKRSMTAQGIFRATGGWPHLAFLCPLPTSSSSWWYLVPWSIPKATLIYTSFLIQFIQSCSVKKILGKTVTNHKVTQLLRIIIKRQTHYLYEWSATHLMLNSHFLLYNGSWPQHSGQQSSDIYRKPFLLNEACQGMLLTPPLTEALSRTQWMNRGPKSLLELRQLQGRRQGRALTAGAAPKSCPEQPARFWARAGPGWGALAKALLQCVRASRHPCSACSFTKKWA